MSKPIDFKKMRDFEVASTPTQPKSEKAFLDAVAPTHNNEVTIQPLVKSGKVTTVVLDEDATVILEQLSKLEDRSERKITARLLNAALRNEWEKTKNE